VIVRSQSKASIHGVDAWSEPTVSTRDVIAAVEPFGSVRYNVAMFDRKTPTFRGFASARSRAARLLLATLLALLPVAGVLAWPSAPVGDDSRMGVPFQSAVDAGARSAVHAQPDRRAFVPALGPLPTSPSFGSLGAAPLRDARSDVGHDDSSRLAWGRRQLDGG
jgi:hypothetical protein